VLQGAMILQERYRWANRKAIKEKDSFKIVMSSLREVEIMPERLKGRIGASFSKIADLLNLSKSYCHSLIRDLQVKNSIVLWKVHYKYFKLSGLRGEIHRDPKLSYSYDNKMVTVTYSLASSYPTSLKSFTKRKDLYKQSIYGYSKTLKEVIQKNITNTTDSILLANNRIVHEMGQYPKTLTFLTH